MSIKNKVDDEKLIEIYKQETANGPVSKQALATKMGVARTTIIDALHRLAREGRLGTGAVLPGFAIKSTSEQRDDDGNVVKSWVKQGPAGETFAVPEGHSVKGVSALVDGQGVITAQWIKTKETGIDPKAFIEELETAFQDFKPCAEPRPIPGDEFIDQLSLYCLGDPHIGMLAWNGDAERNWDLKLGVKAIKKTSDAVIARTPQTKKAILIVGGDTLHADNNENTTARSGNALQVDGRYPKILLAACELLVSVVASMLNRHEEIDVIVLGGNHDEHASFAISFFLHAWFRNEPRVIVDTSAAPIRFRQFGKTFIATTHGHATKAKDLAAVMAAREPRSWGTSVHRFGHVFHVHHASKLISEGGGVITETHQIIAPQDAWHFGAGFLSGRSMQSIVYDKEHGEVGRIKVSVVD